MTQTSVNKAKKRNKKRIKKLMVQPDTTEIRNRKKIK